MPGARGKWGLRTPRKLTTRFSNHSGARVAAMAFVGVTQPSTEWSADLDELKRLKGLARRPNVLHVLDNAIADATARRSEAAAAVAEAEAAPPSADGAQRGSDTSVAGGGAGTAGELPAGAAADADMGGGAAVPTSTPSGSSTFRAVSTFAFDQSDKYVSVYVTLPGVGKSGATVELNCTSNSFDLKVLGYEGANYRLVQGPLYKEIDPAKSKHKVKADRIVILLRKVETEFSTWPHLKAKKQTKKKADYASNPAASINDMMREMYEEGDDQTRKLIAEAMIKSREGRTSPPPAPGLDDMDDTL